jgi:NADPH:quinone reductase
MMQVMEVRRTGGPEVLVAARHPLREPGRGEVLIAQDAVGVNFVDLQHRAGGPYPALPLPLVPGIEGVGRVMAVGDGVATGVRIGDRVAYAGAMPGCYASHAILDAQLAIPLAKGHDPIRVASVLMQGLTAHYLTHDAHPVQAGEWVLIHAAASGVGRLALAYAVARGGRVIAATRRAGGALRATGAALVLSPDDPAFVERVRAISGGCHVVYDPLGGGHFERALFCLRARGDLVSYGLAAGLVPPFDVARLAGYWDAGMAGSTRISRTSLGDFVADRPALLARAGAVLADVAAGRLPLPEVRVMPLSAAAEAHRKMAAGGAGKIVMVPDGA